MHVESERKILNFFKSDVTGLRSSVVRALVSGVKSSIFFGGYIQLFLLTFPEAVYLVHTKTFTISPSRSIFTRFLKLYPGVLRLLLKMLC